jgi:hypothetical protein
MQEIITEILERHGFPTKNVEKLTTLLENWKLKDLTSGLYSIFWGGKPND